MVKKQSLSTVRKFILIGFSTFLFGTGASILTPETSASPGFLEHQWDPKPGYKRLKYYQSSSEKLDRATYYFFLRGQEREENIIKLTLTVPDYFDAKIKSKKLSLCKVKIGGFKGRTSCIDNIPSIIKINKNQTSIEIFPESPIPRNKENYAVVMKIFNPRKEGMYQFQALAQSQQSEQIPISTYLGTWNITVQ